ncbi:MAG TPA: transglycosylase domain-containing protein [Acidimicrobiia bacterium]|nr:transglycosylase domain-containing protein [Acidimicrobiia bacterium]
MSRKALIHQVEARERRGRWFGALATLLSIAVLASTWIGLFGFMGTNAAFGTFEELQNEWVPDAESMELSLPDLSQVSRVFAADDTLLAELHDGRNSQPVRYPDIPETVVHAVLAAEDADFFEHEGIDFEAIASAAADSISGDLRGGSTITQQVVKQVFVGDEISLRRKVTEAFVSAELERRFPKTQILEYYLNSVYFGASAYGVKAAALEFFGKGLNDLTVSEAASMAVLVRNPTFYDPRRRPEEVLGRRDQVIDLMAEKEWITEEEAEQSKDEPLGVIPHIPFVGEADHVVAEVKRQLLNDPQFEMLGATNVERKQAIFGCPADDTTCEGGGGLRIETVVDLRLQEEANRILREWMPPLPGEENLAACIEIFPEEDPEFLEGYAESHSCAPTGALTMIENQTGAVKVMASGLDFEFTQFDLAVQGRRNPGSAFKPFGLVAALENGVTLGHRFNASSPQTFECPSVCSERGNEWRVGGAGVSGFVTLDQATSSSLNTVFAQVALHENVGAEKIVEVAHRMGIRSPLTPVPSLVLGTSEVSTLEMASAYSTFATQGLLAEPFLISRILDSEGNVIYEHQVDQQRVLDERVAATALRPLRDVPTSSGTAPRANIGRPQAGKTGTHQSFRDAWYVGFTPEYSTAVWVGYEAKQQPLENVVINGETYSRVFGGSVPAPIWAEFMSIVTEGIPESEFPPEPPGMDEFLTPPKTTVPLVVGLDVGSAIARLEDADLNVTVSEQPSIEPEGQVFAQSIGAGAEVDVGTGVAIYVSNGEPPIGQLPDLVGQGFEQALETLRAFEEETGVLVNLARVDQPVDNPDQVGVILATDPEPGAEVAYGVTVTAAVGTEPPDNGNGNGNGNGGGNGGDADDDD